MSSIITTWKRIKTKKNNKDEGDKDEVQGKKRKKKKKVPTKPQRFICRLNHKKTENFKSETDKTWFSASQRFFNSSCLVCRIKIGVQKQKDIFVPSERNPIFMCNNSPIGDVKNVFAKDVILN